MTRWPVAFAAGIATRPLPMASSTSGPSAFVGELDVEDVSSHYRPTIPRNEPRMPRLKTGPTAITLVLSFKFVQAARPPPRTCWTRVCGQPTPRGSWPAGSAVPPAGAPLRAARRPVRACCGTRGRGVHRQTAGAAHHAGPYACRRVGAHAVGRGRAGVGAILGAGASRASAPVSERVVSALNRPLTRRRVR